MDRSSGSGALSRYPDVIATINPIEEPKKGESKPEGDATVSLDTRWFAKRPDFPIWWRGGHYSASKGSSAPVADIYARYEPLRRMPPKKLGTREASAVAAWMAEACKLNLAEAWNKVAQLSADGCGFVVDQGGGVWCGANWVKPSEESQDDDIPF
jgi:hypothetical protein